MKYISYRESNHDPSFAHPAVIIPSINRFGLKRDGVTGEWRKLHNEELLDLYSSTVVRVIKSRMRWAGHVARMGEGRGVYRVFGGKT
jgi:hypothetical protein